MDFIELGTHKIEVSASHGKRYVRHSDVKELLQLNDDAISDAFVDAGFVTDRLFRKVYVDNNATPEQEIILGGLVTVGIYALIDEVCKVDLRGVSYIKEFQKNFLSIKVDSLK